MECVCDIVLRLFIVRDNNCESVSQRNGEVDDSMRARGVDVGWRMAGSSGLVEQVAGKRVVTSRR